MIQAITSQIFTCQTPLRNLPLASSLLNLYVAVFQGRFQRITQSRQPRQAPSCSLYYFYLISLCPSILVASRFTIHKSERPDLPTSESSHTKGTYQIITCSISSARTAFGACKPTPSDIVEIFSSCTTFALSLSLHYHRHIPSQPPQLHQASTPTQELTIFSDNKFMPHATADMGEVTINGDMPESYTISVST